MSKTRIALVVWAALLSGCAQVPMADQIATQVAVRPLVDATLTALAPTLTPLPPILTRTPEHYGPPVPPFSPVPRSTMFGTPWSGSRDAGYPVPPTGTRGPTVPPTATPIPSATPSPSPIPTPLPTVAYERYSGPPFEVYFTRGGNLWWAEVGGAGERQLTFEAAGWEVDEYAPAGPEQVFVLTVRWEKARTDYGLVRRPAEVVGSLLDAPSGTRVDLLDDLPGVRVHILAVYSGEIDLLAGSDALRLDLATGERKPLERADEVRFSPDGRYEVRRELLIGAGYLFPASMARVSDLVEERHWQVEIDWLPPDADTPDWCQWAPDGRYLLLAGERKGPASIYSALYRVDLSTHGVQVLNPDGVLDFRGAAWGGDADTMLATACTGGTWPEQCEVVSIDPESGAATGLREPVPFEARYLAWVGGERLLFEVDDRVDCYEKNCPVARTTVWTALSDGSHLSPVLWAADMPQVIEASAAPTARP